MIVKLQTETDFHRKARKKERSDTAPAVRERTRTPFLDILEEVLPPASLENVELHELWADLPSIEKELIENQSQQNLNLYRDTVREILRKTLERNVQVRKLYRRNRKNEKVELNVIEILDERLHRMALMLRSPGNTAFSILKTLDEIRGFLLDLKE